MKGFSVAFLLALLIGCGAREEPATGWGPGHWSHPKNLETVVPKSFQRTIRHARTVEVGLVNPRYDAPGTPTGEHGYSLRSGWARLSEPQAREAETLLLDRTHWQTMGKKCEFEPGIALRWTTEKDTAVALVCLYCYQMMGHVKETRMGGEFDPSADRWLTWAASTFPADSTMQAFVVKQRGILRREEEMLRRQR